MTHLALYRALLSACDYVEAKGVTLPDWAAEIKTPAVYRRVMTNDIHALYSRAMSRRDFVRDLSREIETQLTEAWNRGADEMMVLPEDMSKEDHKVLSDMIANEKDYLDGLADAVQQAQSDRTGWDQFAARVDLWVNRYEDAINRARLYFGGKQKMIWRMGATEDHCPECYDLNGIVAWASEWEEIDIHPQAPPNDKITCGGWKCLCTLSPTNERKTYGAMAKLREIAGRHG